MKGILGTEYYRALDAELETVKEQLIHLRENLQNGTQAKVSGREAYKALVRKKEALLNKIENIGSSECIIEFLVKKERVTYKKYFVNVTEELARMQLEGEGYTVLMYNVLHYQVT